MIRLSPIYLQFMVEMIGINMSKSLFIPLSTMEQSTLLVIALHMATCEDDCHEIMEGLKEYGDMIHNFWGSYVEAVRGHNSHGRTSTFMNVNEMMERMRNDPSYQRPIGL